MQFYFSLGFLYFTLPLGLEPFDSGCVFHFWNMSFMYVPIPNMHFISVLGVALIKKIKQNKSWHWRCQNNVPARNSLVCIFFLHCSVHNCSSLLYIIAIYKNFLYIFSEVNLNNFGKCIKIYRLRKFISCSLLFLVISVFVLWCRHHVAVLYTLIIGYSSLHPL